MYLTSTTETSKPFPQPTSVSLRSTWKTPSQASPNVKLILNLGGLYGIDNLSNSTTALLQELIDADFKVEFKEESNGEYNVIIQDKEGTINEEVIAEGLGECTAEIPAWQ